MEKKMYKIRLKKGDLVQVLSGKYKGKQGKVVRTHATENKVTVRYKVYSKLCTCYPPFGRRNCSG